MIRRPRHRVTVKPPFATHFLEGVERFNGREFWNAHESWEKLWLVAETDLDQFLQGLIQLAAAYHHLQRGTTRGAVRLFDAALRRLEAFPPIFCGIDRSLATEAARLHRDRIAEALSRDEVLQNIEEFPQLARVPVEQAPMPQNQHW